MAPIAIGTQGMTIILVLTTISPMHSVIDITIIGIMWPSIIAFRKGHEMLRMGSNRPADADDCNVKAEMNASDSVSKSDILTSWAQVGS